MGAECTRRKYVLKVLIPLYFLQFISVSSNGQQFNDSVLVDDAPKVRQMNFFELTIGIDKRRAQGTYKKVDNTNAVPYIADAFGWTGRMQSSFIANYLFSERNEKWKAGDLLSGELSLGGISTNNPHERSGLWLAYRFDFGASIIYKINKGHDLGIVFTLLKFSRDKVSPNISGSGITFRYRCMRIQAELGVESRRERMFGYLMRAAPFQFTATVKYLISGHKNAGLKIELLSGNRNILHIQDLEVKKVWSMKLFYGIYF